MILLSMFTITKEQSVLMNLKERLIKRKEELDKKALRDPRTAKELAIVSKWERLRSILIKRYDWYGHGIEVVVMQEDDGYPD